MRVSSSNRAEMRPSSLLILLGQALPLLGLAAGTLVADGHLDGHRRVAHGLGVGIAQGQAHALDILPVHVVDGVTAAAAYAHDLYLDRLVLPLSDPGDDEVGQLESYLYPHRSWPSSFKSYRFHHRAASRPSCTMSLHLPKRAGPCWTFPSPVSPSPCALSRASSPPRLRACGCSFSARVCDAPAPRAPEPSALSGRRVPLPPRPASSTSGGSSAGLGLVPSTQFSRPAIEQPQISADSRRSSIAKPRRAAYPAGGHPCAP